MDWSRVRFPPKPHQRIGTSKLIANPAFALFDQVGAGKTKQVIDAAFWLHAKSTIDALLVVAPASVRSVWADPDPVLGEVAKHAWPHTPFYTQEYHSRTKGFCDRRGALVVLVTNYEFIRRQERLDPLIAWAAARRTYLVVDESWMVQSHTAQQMKAVFQLRQACQRVTLLNGTPGHPGQLYSQFAILDRRILGFKNYYAFRAHHARMGGFLNKEVVEWIRMEEFEAKTANYALRRLTRDCFDLGDPPNRTQIEVRLTPATWAIYCQMRDELVAWLSTEEASIAGQAGVKAMRLAQITAGFVGGVVALGEQAALPEGELPMASAPVRVLGREKLDGVIAWLQQQGVHKAVVWGRFRAEIERTASALQTAFPTHKVGLLYGGQSTEDRHEVKQWLAPGGDPAPALVVGHAASGGAGLNFSAANLVVYLSNSFSHKDRDQSEGRFDRPGQTQRVTFLDVLATGPNGQKTIDHHVAAALRRKEDLATATAAVWRRLLTEV